MKVRFYAGVIAATLAAWAPGAAAQDSQAGAEERSNEIVVTAQRREQALQDVSLAVTAVGAERLQSAQIHTIEDLQRIVPSIYLGNDFNMAKLFIRGVGANTSTTGSETGVAMHVDGAFVARAEAQLASLFDLERVEVLRGPQGTLYGRNAVGGSVNLITAKPTAELEGYFRGAIGTDELVNVAGAVSGPIAETVLGRVAFQSENRGGFGVNPVTGNDVDDLNRQMVRAHLMFTPDPAFDVLLTGEYYTQNDASRALKFRRASYPGVVRLANPGEGGYAVDPRDLASEFDPATETEAYAATATTTWRVSENITLSNITSYRDIKGFITQDLDVSAVINSAATTNFNTTVQRRDIDGDQFSTEFQGTFESDLVNAVLGLFYFTEEQRPVDTVGLTPIFGQPQMLTALVTPTPGIPGFATSGIHIDGVAVTPPLDVAFAHDLCNTFEYIGAGVAGFTPPPKRVCIKSQLESDAWALFGQVNINLGVLSEGLSAFSIKLGGRYSEEDVSAKNASIIYAANGFGSVLGSTLEGSANSRTFEDFTPEAGVEFRPVEDLLLYYTYSEGFKAGAGENAANPGPGPFTSVIVDPEEIENHDIGLRSSFMDGRLLFNVSAFTYELTGQQINKTIAGGPAGFSTIFQNAAATSADGIEVEVFAAPSDMFRFSGAVSWLDSNYDDFLTVDPLVPQNVATAPPTVCPAADPPITWQTTCAGFVPDPLAGDQQRAGNRTRNSPEWSANLHAELDFGHGAFADGVFTVMGDVAYRDDVYFTEFQRLLEGQEAYTIWDFNLRYGSAGDRFVADLWVKNATDELVATSTFALATARTIGVTYLPPRTYGVTLGYRF